METKRTFHKMNSNPPFLHLQERDQQNLKEVHAEQLSFLENKQKEEEEAMTRKHEKERSEGHYEMPSQSTKELEFHRHLLSASHLLNEMLRLIARKILARLKVQSFTKPARVEHDMGEALWELFTKLLKSKGWQERQYRGQEEYLASTPEELTAIFHERRLQGSFLVSNKDEGRAWVWVTKEMPVRCHRTKGGTVIFLFWIQASSGDINLTAHLM